jgi:hypothetical protein
MAIPAATTIVSNALSTVTGAIRNAAQATGTSFNYLLATAQVESRLDPTAAAPTSSAVGLFQFIEQTWLGMIKQAGSEHGYSRYADAIQRSVDGRCYVADPAMRAEIMKLRFDPAANAAMAGAFTNDNAAFLTERIGRVPTEGELYIAHFFGPSAACRLISLAAEAPQRDGAAQFPAAAKANRSIFYDRQGNTRSVSQVYSELVRRYRVALAQAVGSTETAVASAVPAPSTLVPTPLARPASAIAPAGPAGPLPPRMMQAFAAGDPAAAVADTAPASTLPSITVHPLTATLPGEAPSTVFEAFAAATPVPRPAESDALFHALFRPGRRDTALAPVVNELWGTPTPRAANRAPGPAAVASATQPRETRRESFELFRDAILPNLRAMFQKSA